MDLVVVTSQSLFRCAPRAGELTRVGQCVGWQVRARDQGLDDNVCRRCEIGARVAATVGVTFDAPAEGL